jgi:hypothetical protein
MNLEPHRVLDVEEKRAKEIEEDVADVLKHPVSNAVVKKKLNDENYDFFETSLFMYYLAQQTNMPTIEEDLEFARLKAIENKANIVSDVSYDFENSVRIMSDPHKNPREYMISRNIFNSINAYTLISAIKAMEGPLDPNALKNIRPTDDGDSPIDV